jgi:hypothetical protein
MAGFDSSDIAAFNGATFITQSKTRYVIDGNHFQEYIFDQFSGKEMLGAREKITAIGGLKDSKPWFGRLTLRDRFIATVSIPGAYVSGKECKLAYELRSAEAEEAVKDFLNQNGNLPRIGDFLVLGASRSFESYFDELDRLDKRRGERHAYSDILPARVTSPIAEIL